MQFYRYIIILLASCCCSLAMAQDNFVFTSYGVDDGLPQSSVIDVVQDKHGFLWVGTADGICRFDGYKFIVYRGSAGDSNILAGGIYNKFYCDSSGGLWTVSQNGVCRYDDVKDRFIGVFSYQRVYSNNYNCIAGEDEQYVYAIMCGYGLLKVDKHTRKVNAVKNELLSGIPSCISAVLSGEDIWIMGGMQGSMVYNIRSGKLRHLQNWSLTAIINYNDSQVLCASYRGIVLINKHTFAEQFIPLSFGEKTDENVTDILSLSSTELMITSSIGVYYVNTPNWAITKHVRSFSRGQQSTFAYAQCAYRDRSGNIWIGSNGDGLKKLMAPYKKFKYYSSYKKEGNLVKSIFADSRNLYVGYYGAGLDVFDRKLGFLKSASLDRSIFQSNNVLAITSLDTGVLLLQTSGANALASYTVKSNSCANVSFVFRSLVHKDFLANSYPFFMRSGNIIYTDVAEYNLLSFNTDTPHRLQPSVVTNGIGEKLVCSYIARDSSVWLGTLNGVVILRHGSLYRLPLPGLVHVKSINQDAYGNMWLGTVKGIYIVDHQGKVTHHYTESNGLANQFVYGILRDDGGNMWFSHNKGISVYNITRKTFRHYTKDDGLQSNEFNTGAYFKSADGELFFGGIAGTTSFYPADITDNPTKPVAKITGIKLFDVPIKTDTAYWNVRSLTFSYLQNSLSFEFAALEFTDPLRNRYAYMMEGIDKDWIVAGDEHFARYAALPPGRYVFKVMAANNDGVWQQIPTTVAIIIVPPFWQQWWFRVFVVIVIVAVVSAFVLWLQRIKHRREIRALELRQKIQLERERISRDLHDTVGTQLSLISNNIEWVAHPLKELSDTEKADKLQFVNETARDIIGTLRETIWALNKQQIPLEEFSDKLKAFVQKQLNIYPQTGLEFTEQIADNMILGPSEALDLFRICQEAVANALKYAEATAITIAIHADGGRYTITVKDNGKGFDINAVDPSVQNGLENMKFRAQDIGSILEINSSAGNGTQVSISKK